MEEVLLAAGEQVGHGTLLFSQQMNKAVMLYRKDEAHVDQWIESGGFIRDIFAQVSPLSVPSTVSGVPPFIPNELLENELLGLGEFGLWDHS